MALPDRINGDIIWAHYFNDIHALLNNLGNNTTTIAVDTIIATSEFNTYKIDANAGSVTVTLPDANSVDELKYTFKCVDFTNDITIQCFGVQEIDGDPEYNFSMRNESVTLLASGGVWNAV